MQLWESANSCFKQPVSYQKCINIYAIHDHHQTLLILTTDTKHTTLFIEVQALIAERQYSEAIRRLEEGVPSAERNTDYFLLYARAVHAQGLVSQAVRVLDEGLSILQEESPLMHKRNEYHSQHRKLENAINQISAGQHTTPDVNFMKANTKQLIEAECFEEAIRQLSELSEARKQKTTNILWIGNYLKDVYFHPNAKAYQSRFDDLLFEEMLFYYLKACKLFEPEYKIIQEAKKKLRASESGN